MLKQEWAFYQTVATKLEAHNFLECPCSILDCPFTGTKGPSLNHEKQPQTIISPPLNFTIGSI
uniref:Uncharacterized protein n=1 Tax=Anguilla anguilla TaxID=7936 RepID=A0A0E9T0A5_ANGAN